MSEGNQHPELPRRSFLKKAGTAIVGGLLVGSGRKQEHVPIERKGSVATIYKPEGTYVIMYNDHVTARNPDLLPEHSDGIFFEGTAGEAWATKIHQTDAGLSTPSRMDSLITSRYRHGIEYGDLFQTLVHEQTPILLADVEFDRNFLVKEMPLLEDAYSSMVDILSDTAETLSPRSIAQREKSIIPDTPPWQIADAIASGVNDAIDHDAMTYPTIAVIAETAIGGAMFMQMAKELRGSNKLSRRDFLKAGAKAATAGWLTIPSIEAFLFTQFGTQEIISPEITKLVEKTHPEVWFLILTLRNVLLAQKQQWLMEKMGNMPTFGTTIGSAHANIEEQIMNSPEERMQFLRAAQPFLKSMFVPESVYKIVRFDPQGAVWEPGEVFEVPALKELVPKI